MSGYKKQVQDVLFKISMLFLASYNTYFSDRTAPFLMEASSLNYFDVSCVAAVFPINYWTVVARHILFVPPKFIMNKLLLTQNIYFKLCVLHLCFIVELCACFALSLCYLSAAPGEILCNSMGNAVAVKFKAFFVATYLFIFEFWRHHIHHCTV